MTFRKKEMEMSRIVIIALLFVAPIISVFAQDSAQDFTQNNAQNGADSSANTSEFIQALKGGKKSGDINAKQ